MKGYIVLRKDMTYKEGKRPFEIGKEYMIPPTLEASRGYRFVLNFEDIPFQRSILDSRVFEIEASEEKLFIPERGSTLRASKMRVIREVYLDEIKADIESKKEELVCSHFLHRSFLVDLGIGLNYLMFDHLWLIRLCVAEQGYGLDKLIHDEDSDVRRVALETMKKLNRTKNKAG